MRMLISLLAIGFITGLIGSAEAWALQNEAEPAAENGEQVTSPAAEADDHAAGHVDHDLTHANLSESGESPAEIKWDLAIYTFVVFLLLLIILAKFAWGPIASALDERERVIADSIASAQRLQADAAAKLADYEKQIIGAKDEVRELLERGRREAEVQGQSIVTNAQAAAARESERARAEIEAAKNQALGELAQKSIDTAVNLAGQIVRRSITPADHAQLIQDAVEQFPSRN